MKEQLAKALIGGTSFDLRDDKRYDAGELDKSNAIYWFHIALSNQDDLALSRAAATIMRYSYLSRPESSKTKHIHSNIQEMLGDFSSNAVFGKGIVSNEEVMGIIRDNIGLFKDIERKISAHGKVALKYTYNDKKITKISVLLPHEFNECDGHIELYYDVGNLTLVECHSIGLISYNLLDSKGKPMKLDEKTRQSYISEGILLEDKMPEFTYNTIQVIENDKKHVVSNIPQGDLYGSETLLSELYSILGKESRALELGIDKFIVDDMLFTKNSSGEATLDKDNDVYMSGSMGEGSKIEQVSFDMKENVYSNKIQDKLSQTISSTGYNASSFGIGDDGGVASGRALSIKERRTTAKINGKKENWLKHIEIMLNTIADITGQSIGELELRFPNTDVEPAEHNQLQLELFDRNIISAQELKDNII